MPYFLVRGESDNYCGCWEEICVESEDEDSAIDENSYYLEEYIRTEFLDEEEDEAELGEGWDSVSVTAYQIPYEEYLKYKSR